jgi:hypothetical protein
MQPALNLPLGGLPCAFLQRGVAQVGILVADIDRSDRKSVV